MKTVLLTLAVALFASPLTYASELSGADQEPYLDYGKPKSLPNTEAPKSDNKAVLYRSYWRSPKDSTCVFTQSSPQRELTVPEKLKDFICPKFREGLGSDVYHSKDFFQFVEPAINNQKCKIDTEMKSTRGFINISRRKGTQPGTEHTGLLLRLRCEKSTMTLTAAVNAAEVQLADEYSLVKNDRRFNYGVELTNSTKVSFSPWTSTEFNQTLPLLRRSGKGSNIIPRDKTLKPPPRLRLKLRDWMSGTSG